MRYLQARKLHNEDEVKVGKRRGRAAVYQGRILSIYDYPKEKRCTFDIVLLSGLFLREIPHTQVF